MNVQPWWQPPARIDAPEPDQALLGFNRNSRFVYSNSGARRHHENENETEELRAPYPTLLT